jgi:hypothetical protein
MHVCRIPLLADIYMDLLPRGFLDSIFHGGGDLIPMSTALNWIPAGIGCLQSLAFEIALLHNGSSYGSIFGNEAWNPLIRLGR